MLSNVQVLSLRTKIAVYLLSTGASSPREVIVVVGDPGSVALILFGVMAMQFAIMYPAGMAGLAPRTALARLRRRRRETSAERQQLEAAEGGT